METIGYIASILIGITLGLLGGGGSILTIPVLIYLFHIDEVMAPAYSLFIVGVTSLFGLLPKFRSQLVNVRAGMLFGLPSIITVFITRTWIVPNIPSILFEVGGFAFTKRGLILGLFALLMLLSALAMVRKKNDQTYKKTPSPYLIILEGALVGLVTGLVGAGGGFLIIPALVLFARLPMKTAVGTSLLIIALKSLIGFTGDVINHPIDWAFLWTLTSLSVIGIFIGNRLSGRVAPERLEKAFGWFLMVMGTWIVFKEFAYPWM